MSGIDTAAIEIPTSLATMPEQEAVDSVITKQMQFEEKAGKPLCFILAKKHSQRLPGKNKLSLGGKPLVVHAIEAAVKSEIFGGVIVSSDDLELLEIAYENKALIHKRPYELCTPKIQMKQVIRFLLSVYKCDVFCMMSPCNPFVTPEDLKAGYDMLINQEANYVISVNKGKPIEYALTRNKDGFITPRLGMKRTQEMKPVYYADGGFVFSRRDAFQGEFNYGFYGSRCALYETPHISVDIDTKDDFEYARFLMEGK